MRRRCPTPFPLNGSEHRSILAKAHVVRVSCELFSEDASVSIFHFVEPVELAKLETASQWLLHSSQRQQRGFQHPGDATWWSSA